MSLFINGLAFSDPVLVDSSKLGIFIGSIVSAVAGYLILKSRYQTNS
jgi:NhaA family Na+:H+ antiporter